MSRVTACYVHGLGIIKRASSEANADFVERAGAISRKNEHDYVLIEQSEQTQKSLNPLKNQTPV